MNSKPKNSICELTNEAECNEFFSRLIKFLCYIVHNHILQSFSRFVKALNIPFLDQIY